MKMHCRGAGLFSDLRCFLYSRSTPAYLTPEIYINKTHPASRDFLWNSHACALIVSWGIAANYLFLADCARDDNAQHIFLRRVEESSLQRTLRLIDTVLTEVTATGIFELVRPVLSLSIVMS